MNFEDDLDAVAKLGWGPDSLDRMAEIELQPGDFAAFQSLDRDTRQLVLRLLSTATEQDFAALAAHPASKSLARWLLTLPAYVNSRADDEEA